MWKSLSNKLGCSKQESSKYWAKKRASQPSRPQAASKSGWNGAYDAPGHFARDCHQKKDLPVKVSDDDPSSHVSGVQLLAGEDLQYEKRKKLQQQELNFETVHQTGRKHANSDALSRMPYQQCSRDSHNPSLSSSSSLKFALNVPQIPSVSSIREEQLADPSLGMILRGKGGGPETNFGEKVSKQIQLPTPADLGSTDST